MPPVSTTRLNKFISESGFCSRREADRFIEQGQVLIDGKPARVGDQVRPGSRVTVNGHKLEPKQADDAVYLAFNKPVGITSTTEPGVRGNIVDYVNHAARVFPIGRLDKDSQGLIFLTSNGDLVNKILRAGNNHEKEYLVQVDRVLTDRMLEEMAQGIPMLGTVTKPCLIQKETPFLFRITLVQGLNRQIRRMVEHFGYEVVKLERVRIMNVTTKGLPVGDWRELTEQELAGIMKMVEKSRGTEEASGGRPRSKAPADNRGPKSGPPSPQNPASNGWWGPRPDKSQAAAPGKRATKGGTARRPGPSAGRPAAKNKAGGRGPGPAPRR
jgi:23S rRNA pseudouridine2604 synthase